MSPTTSARRSPGCSRRLPLAEREAGDAERRLTCIASEADRLGQLIARTLQLVRLERSVGTFEHGAVDVAELLRVEAREHRTDGGEGLRLAIDARAVSLHSGGIEARDAQSGGLAILITLPSPRTEAAVAAACLVMGHLT